MTTTAVKSKNLFYDFLLRSLVKSVEFVLKNNPRIMKNKVQSMFVFVLITVIGNFKGKFCFQMLCGQYINKVYNRILIIFP